MSVKPRAERFNEQLEKVNQGYDTADTRRWLEEWITEHSRRAIRQVTDMASEEDTSTTSRTPMVEDATIQSRTSVVEIRIFDASTSGGGNVHVVVNDQSVTGLLYLPRDTQIERVSALGRARNGSSPSHEDVEDDAVSVTSQSSSFLRETTEEEMILRTQHGQCFSYMAFQSLNI